MSSDSTSDRPNILLIYTDDQDPARVGCYGGDVLTPAIDRLADEGIRFDRFYVTSALCAPSRYSCLTGRYASRSQRLQEVYQQGDPINLNFEPGITGDAHNVASVLSDAGYATGMVGKWHQGLIDEAKDSDDQLLDIAPDADGRDPETAQALTQNYETVVDTIEACGFDFATSIYKGNPRGMNLPADMVHHNMDWVTEGALEFIDTHRNEPFFLYMAPGLTHSPWGKWGLRTDRRSTPSGYLEEGPDVQRSRASVLTRNQNAGVDMHSRRVDATWLDDGIDSILTRLDELGIAENTVVIFASDNGDLSGKGTCYDGGTRMPFIVRWPDQITPREPCDKLVSNVDIVPTLFEIAGAIPPDQYNIDGENLLPLLTEGEAAYERESLYLEVRAERAVVTADGYKYIAIRYPEEIQSAIDSGARYTHAWDELEPDETLADADHPGWAADRDYPAYYDQDQLYDLNEDPDEQHNLATDPAYQDRLTELKSLLTDYCRDLPHQFGEFS